MVQAKEWKGGSSMKKQDYVLVFPNGMCGQNTITVSMNPLSVRAVVKQIIVSQPLVFGDLCIIKDDNEDVIGIAYQGERDGCSGVTFYTEDNEVEQIKQTEE